jgi:ABC-2 type transport system ATP-binding protein
VLHCDQLCKRFGHVQAVRGVSFRIAEGETYGLLGPNGAGKTTTISMACGLLEPDSGEVWVAGSRLTARSVSEKAAIGYVPQELAIYPDLSARENLRFFARLYGLAPDTASARVNEVLEVIGLVDRASEQTKSFSGGMQRRLNIGIGLLHRPRLLILDEPTVGVDPQSRNAILESVERLADEGMAVLYTTHYMEEAERLCDRVAVMDLGRIVALDTPERLVALHAPGTTITFTSPTTDAAKLSALSGVESAEVSAGSARLVTRSPELVLAQLLHPDGDHPNGISNLRMERGTLEDVFIALTGRELRS